jgi:hypothetical protein
MTVLIRIDILLGFLVNILNNLKNNDMYIYAELIDSNNVVMYSPLNDESGESSSQSKDNKEKNIKNDDEDTVMTESSNENEKFEADTKEVDRVQHQDNNKETSVEEMKWENTNNNEVKEDKGKGKRNYVSESDSEPESDHDKQNISDNLKKLRGDEYRHQSEEYESSDYSNPDYSEDEQSDNSKDNEDKEFTLILRRPEIIDNEIKDLTEDLKLIEKAKNLDSKLPSSAQWLNDNVSKLSSKGYRDYFDKNNGSVKEGLEKVEKHAKKELDSTEAERTRCKDTINAEGSEVKSWDEDTIWVKTSKEQFDIVMDSGINTDSEPDIQAKLTIWDSDEDENENQNEKKNEKNENEKNQNENQKNENENKKNQHNESKNEYSSNEKDTSVSPSLSSNVTDTKDSSIPLSRYTEVTSKTEMAPDVSKNSSSSIDNVLPTTNPSSANSSQKSQGKPDSSVNTTSTDTNRIEDKKLTPGDFIDDLPQDMPGFMDDFD